MSFFAKKISQNASSPLTIGVAENDDYYCILYFLNGKEKVIWQKKERELLTLLKEQIGEISAVNIVRPIPYHYIWRKYFFMPATPNPTTIYKQILHTLKQELPLAINEIYFDFNHQYLASNQCTRIALYALRKNFAEPLILNKQTILDCELHCWQRAYHFLLAQQNQAKIIKNYYYLGKVFEFKKNELFIHSKVDENTATLAQLNLAENIIDPNLYLLALGAALWKK